MIQRGKAETSVGMAFHNILHPSPSPHRLHFIRSIVGSLKPEPLGVV